ncbi:hypothetical protein A3H87_00190 [Candidatus Curtissbacteria bacterium RIFCSPLOWO2_02_FULL_42_37]|nr:MAG: hypothetical protein A3H87_00190 [Candidatus Curtissbacteria bacterium RIFCSPLOWO2_02_FULL_42_37]
MPINIAGKTFPDASGFLPIASMALKPIRPMAKAGPIPPMAIAAPLARTISKIIHLLGKFSIFNFQSIFKNIFDIFFAI